MATLLSFVLTPIGRMLFGGASVLFLVWAYGAKKEYEGGKKVRVQVETATKNDIERAKSAGQKSSSGLGGVPLPFRD